MTIAPLSALPAASFAAAVPPPLAPAAAGTAAGAAGESFGAMLSRGIDSLAQAQATADSLAVQAATGDLTDVHDYTIAATHAQLATELTVAIRNKAVEAFSEIMRMQF